MIKIRISYQTPQEIESILKLLHPAIKTAKIKKGTNKRVYITIR